MSQEMFDNISGLQNTDFLVGNSPDELKSLIDKIRLPAKIIAIYGSGNKHVAWIQSTSKIKKVKKEAKNG